MVIVESLEQQELGNVYAITLGPLSVLLILPYAIQVSFGIKEWLISIVKGIFARVAT